MIDIVIEILDDFVEQNVETIELAIEIEDFVNDCRDMELIVLFKPHMLVACGSIARSKPDLCNLYTRAMQHLELSLPKEQWGVFVMRIAAIATGGRHDNSAIYTEEYLKHLLTIRNTYYHVQDKLDGVISPRLHGESDANRETLNNYYLLCSNPILLATAIINMAK